LRGVAVAALACWKLNDGGRKLREEKRWRNLLNSGSVLAAEITLVHSPSG
jgi:hypothetical protein